MDKEILTVVDVVSNEKGVPKEIIFEALEAALASATKKRFTEDVECRVAINRETGEYDAFRCWAIIDPAQQPELDPDDEGFEEAQQAAELIRCRRTTLPRSSNLAQRCTSERPCADARRFPRRAARSGRVRTHCGADRQAGYRPESAGGRTSAGRRGL